MGTTAMGLPSTPGAIVSSPLYGPSPFSSTTQPAAPDTTLAPVPLALDPTAPGTSINCSPVSAQTTLASPTQITSSGPVTASPTSSGASSQSAFGTPGTARAAGDGPAAGDGRDPAAGDDRAAGHHRHDAGDQRGAGDYRGVNSEHKRDDSNVIGAIDNELHIDQRKYNRDHIARSSARQPLERRMQFYARRPADQWGGFAAFDAGSSGEPAARYNPAGRRPAWRHQHRSGDGGYTNAEHVGMRREHDDVSGSARHDGTGQRHRRRGNAGRIAAGLLTRKTSRLTDTTKGGFRPPFVVAIARISAAVATQRGKELT